MSSSAAEIIFVLDSYFYQVWESNFELKNEKIPVKGLMFDYLVGPEFFIFEMCEGCMKPVCGQGMKAEATNSVGPFSFDLCRSCFQDVVRALNISSL
jgi:hypothetical protein